MSIPEKGPVLATGCGAPTDTIAIGDGRSLGLVCVSITDDLGVTHIAEDSPERIREWLRNALGWIELREFAEEGGR